MTEIIIDEPFLSGDVFVKRRKRIIAFAISFFVFCAFAVGLSLFLYFHFRDTPKDDPKSVNPPKDKVIPAVLPDPVPRIPEEKIIPGPGVKPDIVVTNPEDQKGRTTDPLKPKDVIKNPMSADEVYQELADVAAKKNYTVVKGTFKDCMSGRCVKPSGKFIEEWKLRYAAKILDGKPNLDMEYEFDTILAYDKHGRIYRAYFNPNSDYIKTYSTFKYNKKIIDDHNSDPNRLYNMELNSFVTMENISLALAKYQIPNEKTGHTKTSRGGLKSNDQDIHIDWRDKGMVTDVMHQGACSSCWAVVAADLFSSFMAIKTNKKVKYSPQQLVDCLDPTYNCRGGKIPIDALNYVKNNKMCTDKEYPYIQSKGRCSAYRCEKEGGIKNIKKLDSTNALEFLKKNGPFTAVLRASADLSFYSDGIFNGSCVANINHIVLVVGHGYDKVKKVDYWIAKNSWGTNWGEDGYFRILDQATSKQNPEQRYCDFLNVSYGFE